MRESYIQSAVIRHAKKMGCEVVSFKERAMPDRQFMLNTQVLLIEFKASWKMPRLNQNHKFLELLDKGFQVFVISDVQEGIKLLNGYFK